MSTSRRAYQLGVLESPLQCPAPEVVGTYEAGCCSLCFSAVGDLVVLRHLAADGCFGFDHRPQFR